MLPVLPFGEAGVLDRGVELIILQVDIPLLYQPVTDQAIENAYTFYGIWWEAPGAIKVRYYHRGGVRKVADSPRRSFM